MPDTLPPCRARPISYEARLQTRRTAVVDLVVIHCTELPDLDTAREYGERLVHASGTGNCGHYYIDRDGSTERWVSHDRTAHHVRGYNDHSLGIELVNSGRYPDWLDSRHQEMHEAYEAAQITALVALLRDLRAALPALDSVAGHEDLDREMVPSSDTPSVRVRRKMDPGPQFPWQDCLAATGLKRIKAQ